jgi:Ca-activated chloride channel family protein
VGTETADGKNAPLETRALKSLARSAGGRYFELTVDDSDVRDIARRIDAHYVVTEDSAVPWLDSGYNLVFPCLALFLLWFRRGWTLQWCLLLCLGLGNPTTARAETNAFLDLWLTPDQQGALLMRRGDYETAATRFSDPFRKGLAYYYAEQFDLAAEYFARVDSAAARFNQANALAHGEHYLRAVAIYESLLAEDPGNSAAEQNRRIVQELIDAINLMSESQADEGLGSKELGDDEPRRAEGAERMTMTTEQLEQLSAEDILQDEKVSEMWMRSVQRDPSHFLSVKFGMQLERQE